jgi:hypothetical protein
VIKLVYGARLYFFRRKILEKSFEEEANILFLASQLMKKSMIISVLGTYVVRRKKTVSKQERNIYSKSETYISKDGCFCFIIHLFTCACIVWVISPPCPPHPPFPPPPLLAGRTCSALISNFVEEKT